MPRINSQPAKPQSRIAQVIKKAGVKSTRKAAEPLWRGPLEDGITQSLLSEFLVCPDRFRVKMIDGLSFDEGFSQRLEYGNMWHVCEESLAADTNQLGNPRSPWLGKLEGYARNLCKKYPLQQPQIQHWYNVCKVQFPIYVDWWKQHNDVKQRTPLMQEVSFKVPYTLPSGRVVTLRGKWDSVDIIGKGKEAAIYLQENKTKGDIDAPLLRRILSSGFELQTMLYLVALIEHIRSNPKKALPSLIGKIPEVAGVRYNVIRRPLSGGTGSIKQRQPTQGSKCPKCKGEGTVKTKLVPKPTKCPKCLGVGRVDAKQGESDEEFYARLGGIIKETIEENGDHYFFMRWKVDISAKDIQRFKDECLNPILERLCNWWELMTVGKPSFPELGIHYRMPYGLYNPMAEGRVDDVDAYLLEGNEVGMKRLETLFPELE